MDMINEDVVISGVGGHFPGSANIEEFQKNLLLNKELLTSRWSEGERGVTNKIGTIPIYQFDNNFFAINHEQSIYLRPITYTCLERTFEALTDAGITPNAIRGKNIGVYMTCGISETDDEANDSLKSSIGYNITGCSKCMLSARISFWLNLKGPSITYHSNWAAGIEAIHLAYKDIKTGLIEAAIVGTASILAKSNMQWIFNDMNLLSPDGKTRPFDADAQGYGRSDGAVVFYLQKASDAKRIYASIVNVATMFNGDIEGNLLNINQPNMTTFLNNFYATSPVKPEEIDFIETYGCGIKECDEKELKSLSEIYCRKRKSPLLVGSVKGNTGHAETASAMFSIAKVIIAMERGIIPANLNFNNPNPNIECLMSSKMEVIQQNKEWCPKYAAVNALNILPSYGHILLKANPKVNIPTSFGIPKLVVAAARNEEGIKNILEMVKYKYMDPEYYQMMLDIFEEPILLHLYRGYALLGASESKVEYQLNRDINRPIWFVYSGMGSQWNGMISDLMELPIFAEAIHKCHQVLVRKGIDLLNILSTDDKTIFDNILNSFVGIAAIQIALTDVLKAIGLVPDGIIGHSVGELGCAYADGCLTAEQMILAAYSRGRASIESNLIDGMMAAVGAGYETIKNKIPSTIEVACHNGPNSSTLSGPKEDMEKFVSELQAQGVFARLVNVSNIAFHSRYIKPAAPVLLKYLKKHIPGNVRRSPKWISTSNLETSWDKELAQYSSPEYHTNNLLSSVYFEEGLKYIPRDAILIEIAPHGLLQAILKRSVKTNCINIPITQRGCNSGLGFFLTALGKIYLNGVNISLSKLYPKIEYPVSRGTHSLAPLTHWNHTEDWLTLFENAVCPKSTSVIDKEISLDGEDFHDFIGHQVNDDIIVPISIYLNIINHLMDNVSNNRRKIAFEDIYIKKHLKLPKTGTVMLHGSLQVGSGNFELLSGSEIIITGKIENLHLTKRNEEDSALMETSTNSVVLNGTDIYSELLQRGHRYSGSFQAIKRISLTDQGSSAVIKWNNQWSFLLEAMIQQQLLHAGQKHQDIQLPNYIRKIYINQDLLPNELLQSEVMVNYEYATNIAATNGLTIAGLQATSLAEAKADPHIDFWKYIPLRNSDLPDIEIAIESALQLLVPNFHQFDLEINLTIVEVQSKESLLEHIRNVASLYKKINITTSTVNYVNKITQYAADPMLFIFNDFINIEILKQFNSFSPQALILAKSDQQIRFNSDFVSIMEFTCNNNQYIVFKRANTTDVLSVYVKDDVLTSKDLCNTSLSWVSDLRDALEISKRCNRRIYLISSVMPLEGFTSFVYESILQLHSEQLRFLFILNKQNSVEIETVFKQDLILSIIMNNKFYAYVRFPLVWKEKFFSIPPIDPITTNRNIHYLGINWDHKTANPTIRAKERIYSSIFDYSGLDSNGRKIMGLAEFDKESGKLIPDSVLKWEVPAAMTLEDCATLPYAYTAAYYVLFIKANLNSEDTVLVHGGCSSIGQAIIYTALALDCTVYTTVRSDVEKKYLKLVFGNVRTVVFASYPHLGIIAYAPQQLNDTQILNLTNCNFQPILLDATLGKGATVIINCCSENLVQSTLNCIASRGRFIHISHINSENYDSIGLKSFLKNVAFHVVNLTKMFRNSHKLKVKIQKLIEDGIFQNKVKQIKKHIYEVSNIPHLTKISNGSIEPRKMVIDTGNNFTDPELNLISPGRPIGDSKSFYLVCEENSENWIQLAEWLTFNGAKYIAICTCNQYIQPNIKRRLDSLKTNFECLISFYTRKANSRKEIVELVSKVNNFRPIHIVFSLHSGKGQDSGIQFMEYIDDALRMISPNSILVNFNSFANGLCQSRLNAGFPTCNIQCDNGVTFSNIIVGLDNILRYKIENVCFRNDYTDSKIRNSTKSFLNSRYAQLLPESLKSLITEFVNSPKIPKIIRLITDSPVEIRELTPLFIIPGLKPIHEIKQLQSSLLLPTYCAQFPATSINLKKLAEKYAELIRKIWPKGPYNLMGINWGGVLMTEIAKVLDKKYQSAIHIYYIDSAPFSIQSIISQLGTEDDEIEINLLKAIFKNSNLEKVRSVRGWNEKIDILLKRCPQQALGRDFILSSLSLLKQRLMDAKLYQPDDNLINGIVHLIRSGDYNQFDTCELSQYYERKPKTYLTTGDPLSSIGSKETAEYINETFQME